MICFLMIGWMKMIECKDILDFLDEIIPDPKCELEAKYDYEFLIAIMLSAQTTDVRVNKVTKVLFGKYDTLEKLGNAKLSDVKKIIWELGNYNKKALAVIGIAKVINDVYWGVVPRNREELEALPMVGRKTVSVFLSEWCDIPNIAVDTHVSRVSRRLGLSKSNDVLKIESDLKKYIPKSKWNRVNQQLVLFGRYFCTARNPKCLECKLANICKKDSFN